MRKILALALLAVLLIRSLPLTVSADYENTYTNTGDQRADIIGVALTQVGYQEGKGTGLYNNDTKYGDWAGWPGRLKPHHPASTFNMEKALALRKFVKCHGA